MQFTVTGLRMKNIFAHALCNLTFHFYQSKLHNWTQSLKRSSMIGNINVSCANKRVEIYVKIICETFSRGSELSASKSTVLGSMFGSGQSGTLYRPSFDSCVLQLQNLKEQPHLDSYHVSNRLLLWLRHNCSDEWLLPRRQFWVKISRLLFWLQNADAGLK